MSTPSEQVLADNALKMDLQNVIWEAAVAAKKNVKEAIGLLLAFMEEQESDKTLIDTALDRLIYAARTYESITRINDRREELGEL